MAALGEADVVRVLLGFLQQLLCFQGCNDLLAGHEAIKSGEFAGQIVQRLGKRFKLLTGADRTTTPRQETLLSTIEWSYELAQRVMPTITLDEVNALIDERDLLYVAPGNDQAAAKVIKAGVHPIKDPKGGPAGARIAALENNSG